MKHLPLFLPFHIFVYTFCLLFETISSNAIPEFKKALNSSSLNNSNSSFEVICSNATEEDFNKVSYKQLIHFKMDKNDAKKIDGILYLKINRKWKPIEIFEDTQDNTEHLLDCEYTYLGKNNALNQYLVASMTPKKTIKRYLVSKNTAQITTIGTEPVISPNHKMFVTLDTIPTLLNSVYSINIWNTSKSKNTVNQVHRFSTDNLGWTPIEIYWESSKSLIIKAIPMNKYNNIDSVLTSENFIYTRLLINPKTYG